MTFENMKSKNAEKEPQAIQNAQKLRECLRLAVQKLNDENKQLSEVLNYGQVFEGVENLEMDVSAIFFPEMKSGPAGVFGFTWEFIELTEHDIIAEDIIEQVYESVEDKSLPESANEFKLS
jgi:hypothetical protein